MDGVGKVVQCSCKGVQQVTSNHNSGSRNIPPIPESWECFGQHLRRVYNVWTVPCSGWCAPPYIYHSLSDAVAQYLRPRDIPIPTWLGDVWISNFRATRALDPTDQQRGSRQAAAFALTLSYHCGYFMALPKCFLEPTTGPISLGAVCDTAQRRLYVPEDRLLKLETILSEAMYRRSILFRLIDKLAGKWTSMSVAVQLASRYAHHMYRQGLHSSAPEAARIYHQSQYRTAEYLKVRTRLNRVPWYDAARHILAITKATVVPSMGRHD